MGTHSLGIKHGNVELTLPANTLKRRTKTCQLYMAGIRWPLGMEAQPCDISEGHLELAANGRLSMEGSSLQLALYAGYKERQPLSILSSCSERKPPMVDANHGDVTRDSAK